MVGKLHCSPSENSPLGFILFPPLMFILRLYSLYISSVAVSELVSDTFEKVERMMQSLLFNLFGSCKAKRDANFIDVLFPFLPLSGHDYLFLPLVHFEKKKSYSMNYIYH